MVKDKQLQRRIVCRQCGANPELDRCKGCGKCPAEKKLVQRQMGHMIIQQEEVVQSKEKCKNEKLNLKPQVERGMKDGETITFPNMGEQKPGVVPGNVVFTVKMTKHAEFQRAGHDLHMKLEISLQEALLGFNRTIKHLDDHTAELSTTDMTAHNQVYKIEGEGMPHRDDPSTFGALFVTIAVKFPDQKLTEDERSLLHKLFDSMNSGSGKQRAEL